MPKTNKTPLYLFSLHVPLLLIAAFAISASLSYGSTQTVVQQKPEVLKSSSKNSQKEEKVKPAKDVVKTQDQPLKVENTVSDSKRVKTEPKNVKEALMQEADNAETTEEADELLETLEEVEDQDEGEVEETIEEISNRPAWKTVLLGTDYKNLGQLRSNMVRNQNTIRKLTKAADNAENEESALLIREQIQEMEQQQTTINNILEENENKFSLLGWVFKLFNRDVTDGEVEEEPESSESTSEE